MTTMETSTERPQRSAMILGVGSFAQSAMGILREAGARVGCFLNRDYGHYGPAQAGPTFTGEEDPFLFEALEAFRPDFLIPMSIDWHTAPWREKLVETGIPILCPQGEAMRLEADREFGGKLCAEAGIHVPRSFRVKNRLDALRVMREEPRPYVIKNPLCSPYSPVHTIVCETVEDTLGWLDRVDYAEGVFLQEYIGTAEIGHFAFVSGGEVVSLATNQEYKRAFTGNMGPVAGAPLAGIAEQDPDDRYGLCAVLIRPLLPWLKQTGFHGPLQVTAIQQNGRWMPIEYNVRLGSTTGAMLLRMVENPAEVLHQVASNQVPDMRWRPSNAYGASLTLAGFGYPFRIPEVPPLPVRVSEPLSCDLWWNEVVTHDDGLYMEDHSGVETGHRIADVVACADTLEAAIAEVKREIGKIRCLGSYYRTDLGESLWPPGRGF